MNITSQPSRMLCRSPYTAQRHRYVSSTTICKSLQNRSSTRALHHDGRNRLSTFWTPTALAKPADGTASSSTHDLLVKAGYLRQAHAGVFHLLPLGLRVQDKLEKLIDKHMRSLGASKVSLSSLSSEELWTRSGRLEGRDSEFLRLTDRKGAKYLLSPTHEEEITTIVANAINSHKDLPLRLYQVSRKYRDEARPRQGLLRGREFLMKDLYTFDLTEAQAIATYEDVRKAYRAFLDELRLPYVVANADSGKMGGNLSHEYHFVSSSGEDNVISCKNCDFAVNEELYTTPHNASRDTQTSANKTRQLISKDRKHLFEIVIPEDAGELNLHVIKRLLPDADTSIVDELSLRKLMKLGSITSTITLVDPRCKMNDAALEARLEGELIHLTQAQEHDRCPQCSEPSLTITQAVEIGHTFHLSTRYSAPLGAAVLDANNKKVAVQMGCHGIGVSRMIAAVSGLLSDDRGLNWPMAVAPFGAVMLAAPGVAVEDISKAYDQLTQSVPLLDPVIDDRQRPLGWKLNDADLLGYPFIIVLGRKWASEQKVELQCRRLQVKQDVEFDDLASKIDELAATL